MARVFAIYVFSKYVFLGPPSLESACLDVLEKEGLISTHLDEGAIPD